MCRRGQVSHCLQNATDPIQLSSLPRVRKAYVGRERYLPNREIGENRGKRPPRKAYPGCSRFTIFLVLTRCTMCGGPIDRTKDDPNTKLALALALGHVGIVL
ncbi:MAG: hypothetical protein JWP25_318 [Bradyrhizobium sp.]|nr:hypothetical protein [Bradyrhizobium sp.]